MRVLLTLTLVACGSPSPAQIAERGWAATERVIAAGERAPTCALAGTAMRPLAEAHREDFIAAADLTSNRDRLAAAADYMTARQDLYRDLETRMTALSERCEGDTVVERVFAFMEDPRGVVFTGSP